MPGWRPHCLRGSIYETQLVNAGRPPSEIQEIEEEKRGVVEVELLKKEGCGLGLTVTGGSDKASRPQISNLRAGSIAQRSDALVVGDFILSVNGIRTVGLKHDEIVNLLKNAGEKVTLEVEYEMPEPLSTMGNIQTRHWEATLDKEGPGYGFTLRGGMKVENMRAYPFTVVAIRAGSSADRDEHIKVGDRISQVNGYKISHLTLTELLSLLQQCGHQTTFTVTYDVAFMDAVEHASGPLLVEIDKVPGSALGIALTHSSYQRKACVCVESIRPMSIADRSGALHVGDHILSIDGASVEHMSVAEATQLLKSGTENSVKLEILPVIHLQHCASREALARKSIAPSLSSFTLPGGSSVSSVHNGTMSLPGYGSHAASSSAVGHFATLSRRSKGSDLSKYTWPAMDRKVNSCMSVVSTATTVRTTNNQVCHSETVEVMLFADMKGLGIVLEGGVFSTASLSHPPTIVTIEPRSAAEKCGVLQEGDRVLQINGMETIDRTLEEVNQFLRESRPRCVLEVEFDVTESVTPSYGTYTVKLAKKSGCTGITINGRCKPVDPLIITDVRRGSAAQRCGSIQPGDKLLAINDVRLDACTVEDATHLLELPDDIVKLKVQRDDPEEGTEGCVTYTVTLQRHGGPLGITISGTEDPRDDIIISELTAGGLAQKTGAMHVGDRLLAINDSTTKNKPLSEAIRMLQSAGDTVTLKIARPLLPVEAEGGEGAALQSNCKPTTPISSIDSAMESWDSMGHDINGGYSGVGNSKAMVVAMPQSNRLSVASSVHQPPSRNSAHLDGSGAGIMVSEDEADWPEEDHDDDDDDDENSSHQSEADEVEDWARALGDLEASSGSEMLKQISASLRQRSTFSLDGRSNASGSQQQLNSRRAEKRSQSTSRIRPTSKSHEALHRFEVKPKANETELPQSQTFDQQLQTIFTPAPIQLHRLTVEKTSAAADFGFSLSDGMYEKGVYVSAVRARSPAQLVGIKAFDRILQVNGHKIRDFDCRMTVPLIAEAGNKMNLVICRNPLLRQSTGGLDLMALDTDSASGNNIVDNKNTVSSSKRCDSKDTKQNVGELDWCDKGEHKSSHSVEPGGAKATLAMGLVKNSNSRPYQCRNTTNDKDCSKEKHKSASISEDLYTCENSMSGVMTQSDIVTGEYIRAKLLTEERNRNIKKASTLPGDGRTTKPLLDNITTKSQGSKASKPAVAAKPKLPLTGKPPVPVKSSVAMVIARFNSSSSSGGSPVMRSNSNPTHLATGEVR